MAESTVQVSEERVDQPQIRSRQTGDASVIPLNGVINIEPSGSYSNPWRQRILN